MFRYLGGLIKSLNAVSYSSHKAQFATKLVEVEKRNLLKREELDSSIINELKRAVPMRKHIRRAFSIHGIGALWSMLVHTHTQ